MSGLIQTIINIKPKRNIGGLIAQVTIEEAHHDTSEVTDQPVEQGSNISDHAFNRPQELTIRCGWSNSGYVSLFNAANDVLSVLSGGAGGTGGNNYVNGVYDKLLKMKTTFELLDINTARRQYKNMLLRDLDVVTDWRTENSLVIRATFKQIIMATTSSATFPDVSLLANPQANLGVQNSGVNTLSPDVNITGGGAFNP
jgi:Dit-like phage tail protein